MDNTGLKQAGFRPFGNQVAIILTEDDLVVLDSPLAKKEEKKPIKKSKIFTGTDKPKIIKGKALEAEENEEKKNNRTFTVAAISLSLVDKPDSPEVGDNVSLLAGTMVEMVVNEVVYGIVPIHRVMALHTEEMKP